MEDRKCPVCDSDALAREDEWDTDDDEEFVLLAKYLVCQQCHWEQVLTPSVEPDEELAIV